MSNKKLGLVLLIPAVILIAGFGVWRISDSDSSTLPSEVTTSEEQLQSTSSSSDSENTGETFSSVEVAKHDNESDCWTIIDGSIYDITPYVSRHPGSDEILRACGVDATTLFQQRQTESGDSVGSGTPHSSSATSQLEDLKIGTLR